MPEQEAWSLHPDQACPAREQVIRAAPWRICPFWVNNCNHKLQPEHVYAHLAKHPDRKAARDELKAIPAAASLFIHEKLKPEGDDEEPMML